jgi:uncharacterized protein (TIGR02001 family)
LRRDRRRRERAILSGAIGLALLSAIGDAPAQVSGSATVVSDYRYRGISLSDGGPAAQAGVAYDAPGGWYAGAFVSTVKFDAYREERGVQAIGSAGYAWRMASGLTLDGGANYVALTASPRYTYPEIHGGFTFRDVSGRLYYSPRYFGQDSHAVYGELNATPPLLEHLRLFVHLGALGSAANKSYGYPPGPLFDGAAGVVIDWERFIVQLSWAGVSHRSGAYVITGTERRGGFVASLSHSF